MARSNQAEIVVTAKAEGSEELEKLARELDGIAQSGSDAAPEASRLADELRKLGQQQAAVTQFAALKRESVELKTQLATAREETARMGRELSAAEKPSAQMRREFDASRKTLDALEQRYIGNQRQLNTLRGTLAQTGVSTGQMAGESRRLDATLTQVQQEARKLSAEQATLAARQKTAAASSREQAAANVENSKAMNLAAGAVRGGIAAVAGTLTAGAAFDAMLQMDGLRLSLETVTGSAEAAAKELEYIKGVSERLGLETLSTANAWVRFSSAAKGTALEGEQARRVFEATASSMARMGKSSADIEGALTALEQMLSKGVVSSEELKGQLGERLPGAFKIAAQSIGVTEAELTKMLESGQLMADQLLPALAAGLEKTFGDADQRVSTLGASWQRLKNSLFGATGEQGNGLLGGALIATFDGLTVMVGKANVQIDALRDKWGAVKAAFAAGDGIAEKFNKITAAAKETVAVVFSWTNVGMLAEGWKKHFGDAAQAAESSSDKTAAAQKKVAYSTGAAGQSLVRLQLDLANARKAQDETSASSERAAKARLDEAKASLEVARASENEKATRQATLQVKEAERALQQVLYQNKVADLELAARELVMVEQQNAGKQKLAQADRDRLVAQQEKVRAISAEVVALENATRAADANALAAQKAADATLAAFKALGVTSQAQAKEAATAAAAAFADVEKAAASGAASVKDVQQAFLAYAQKVIATGDATAIAALSSKAAVLGVGDAFQALADKAGGAAQVAVSSLSSVGSASSSAADQVADATRRIADDTRRIADEVADKQISAVSVFGERLQGLAAETSAATAEMAEETYRKLLRNMTSVDDWWRAIAKSQQVARDAFEMQRSSIDGTVQSLQGMALSANSAELDVEALASRFNLLDDADLSRLRSEVERVNSEVRRLKDEARQATDQLQQMADTAQDEIDRASGNTAAIEQRRLERELARVRELAARSGNQQAAAEAEARVRAAAQQRVDAARAADESARERARAQAEAATSAKQVQATAPVPAATTQTVRIDFQLPEGRPYGPVEVTGQDSAYNLMRMLEDLKRRGAY